MSARMKLAASLVLALAVWMPGTASAQSASAGVSVDVNTQNAPGSYGNFIAALNSQGMHLQRLRRINDLTPAEVTVSDVSTIDSPDNTTAMDNALTRRAGASRTTRTALTNNSVVAGVLSAAGISMDRVVAITVKGHELRDVTVFYK